MSREKASMQILRKVVVDLFIFAGLLLCLAAMSWWIEPFSRGFFCGDESLMYPYKGDTVTVPVLRLYGIGLNLLAFLIFEWVHLRNEEDDIRCLGVRIPAWIRSFYCVALSFGLGACYTELFTNVAKVVIGRPRPHFFDICKPSVNCDDPIWQNRYIQSHEYTCTGSQTDKFDNMILSFLSGHSSWAAYTMVYLALYLQKRMQWRGTNTPRQALQFAALMLSWYTALSRITDYKHHWSDVLAGYSLGVTSAVLVFLFGTNFIQRKKEKDHSPLAQHEVNLNSRPITTIEAA